MSELNKLFVYGTLKSSHNGPMSKKLGSVSTLVSDRASVFGYVYNLGGFPGFVLPDGDEEIIPCVYGELVTLTNPKSALLWLDGYESVPFLYTREIVDVFVPNGDTVKAYIYVYNKQIVGAPIPDGVWVTSMNVPIKFARELA